MIELRQAIADTPARTPTGATAKARALIADAPTFDMMDDGTAAALLSLARDVAGLQVRPAG